VRSPPIRSAGVACILAVAASGALPARGSAEPETIRIAAASDLRFALDEIAAAVRQTKNAPKVEASYGSSGNFFAQIAQGAPFDVFLSADVEYARRLHADGFAEEPFRYATGRLALVVRRDSGLDPRQGRDLLLHASSRRVAIANPAHAPYGRAAEAVLSTWGVYDAVKPRLVFGDSVAQAAQFVDSGAADVGLVAHALTSAPASRLAFAEILLNAHPPLEQTGVILKRTSARNAATRFRDFLTGDEGRAILARFGFSLPAR
jgi:molybdate transport system substrate-binding protein